MAYNRLPIVELFVAQKNFDPDVTVRNTRYLLAIRSIFYKTNAHDIGAGWLGMDTSYDRS